MSSNAIPAQGTKIQLGTGTGPVVYADIAEIKSFNGPGGSAAVIDTTDLNSTGKEKRIGLKDEGQLQMNVNYVPGEHSELRALRTSGEKAPFKLLFNDDANTVWSFEAFVMGFSISGAVDGVIEGQITLEITGSITEA